MVDKTVLIVTPFSDFGELVSQSVRKNNAWIVNSVSTIKALTNSIYNNNFLDYALLDMELGFEKVRKSAFIIRDKFPGTEIILISKKDPPEEAEVLRPWRLLSKPFVENDLLEIFKISSDFQNEHVIDGEFSYFEKEIPDWAKDKNVIMNILQSTITTLDVQEAIIYADNTVLAHTINIQGDDIKNCSSIIYKYMEENGRGELIKQIQLNSNSYLLHVTILAVGIILALLYNPDTSYKAIRYQSRFLSTRIINPQLSSNESPSLPESILTTMGERSSNHQIEEKTVKDLNNTPARTLHPRHAMKFRRMKILEVDQGEEIDRLETPMDFHDEMELAEAESTPSEMDSAELESLWTSSIPEPDPMVSSTYLVSHASIPGPGHESEKGTKIEFSTPRNQKIKPSGPASNDNVEAEKVRNPTHLHGQGLVQLNFACLLIPRIRTYFIKSDLARYIYEEIPSIFLAYGWRLDALIIDRQYMQWIAMIPSTIAPSNHINIVRKESTKMILGNFTRLSKDGLITDFWAPGFLLESGKLPISDRDISEFIQSNRQQYYPDEKIFQDPAAKLFTSN